jgi:TRAP-type C4-dicarboxylate transport system permease small subunit
VVTAQVQVLSRILAVISALATMTIMVLTVVDVTTRIAGGGSVPGLLEYSEVALVFLVFCGIAFGHQKRIHVAVDLVTARMPRHLGRIAVATGIIVLLVILAWTVYATGIAAIESVERGEVRFGITKVPIWPARVMIPVGFFLMWCEGVIQLIAVLSGQEKIRDTMPSVEGEVGA